jgi:hypothetical protein
MCAALQIVRRIFAVQTVAVGTAIARYQTCASRKLAARQLVREKSVEPMGAADHAGPAESTPLVRLGRAFAILDIWTVMGIIPANAMARLTCVTRVLAVHRAALEKNVEVVTAGPAQHIAAPAVFRRHVLPEPVLALPGIRTVMGIILANATT